jgi:DNA polymerase IV
VADLTWIYEFLEQLAGKITSSMQAMNTAGKTITLKVRYKNFETVTRSQTLHHFTNDAEELAGIAKKLLVETEAGEREVRLIGISVSALNLVEGGVIGEQLELPFS